MNNTLIENIKIKSDLQYDFLFESKEYHELDSENKIFLKECYDMGVNQSIYLHQQDKALLESIDEGLWDRFKAGAARVGQGLKNVSGIGTQTADSKDAGVDSLLNSFKTKWAKAPKAQTPPAAGNNPIIAPIVNNVNQNIAQIAAASATSTTPPPTPQQANVIVQQSNAPISLKTKIANLIRANPNKTKFLLGVLSFGAGVAAAAATAGNPIAAKVAAGLVNSLGNVAIAKIQGRGASDQLMAGVGGGLAGIALGGAGASVLSNVSSLFSNAATTAVDATTDGFADTSDGNSPEVQVTQQQSAVSPEDLRTADTEAPDTGYADTSDGNSPEYQATQQQSAVSPEDQSLPDTEAPDTNQYDAQGNKINPQQGFADTSDGNSPETQVTQQQSAVSPEDLRNPDTDQDTFADTSDENSPETQATQQQVANTAQGATQPRFKSALDPRSARVAFDKSRGVIKEEKMFVKSYNNTYTLKKSLNENIEEKWNEGYEETIDEALSPEQTKIYDEFLTDFGKMFKQPKDQVIAFIQGQGGRFKNVLDFLNAEVNPSISGAQPAAPGGAQPGAVTPAAPGNISQITPQLKLDVDKQVKKLLSGLTIINPNVRNLRPRNPATKVDGKNASYVFRLTNTGDIAFVIKGWIGQTPFLYQDKAKDAQTNALKVLVKEIAYKPIDKLKNKFIVELSNVLALNYIKQPQLAGQLTQPQLKTVINNYLNQEAKTNPGFDKLFTSILTLLDSVSARMKASRTKPKQIWIGINNKGMGLFTGLPSKKKVQPGVPPKGNAKAVKTNP